MRRHLLLLSSAIVFSLTGVAAAQFPNPLRPPPLVRPAQLQMASRATRTSLERFKQLLSSEQWDEAVDTIMSLMESTADEVILIDGRQDEFGRYVTVSDYCQWLLVQAHREAPEALRIYRGRVDALAKRWFEEGVKKRDPQLLRRVAEKMFATSSADDATLALGEIALERGDFQSARGHWQRISPAAFTPAAESTIAGAKPDRPLWLGLKDAPPDALEDDALRQWLRSPRRAASTRRIHPDSDVPAADVLARLVIASALEGSQKRAQVELRVLQLLHPDAKGRLAGRQGKWADLLGDLLEKATQWPDGREDPDWRVFAGSPHRSRVAGVEPDPTMRPLWTAPLQREGAVEEQFADGRERTAEWRDANLSVHPIVIGGRVYAPQANSVLCFDLQTGKPGFGAGFDGRVNARGATPEIYRREYVPSELELMEAYGVARHTLASRGNLLFARVGAAHTSWPDAQFEPLKREEWGVIAGLDLNAEGKLLPGFPLAPDDWNWTFDGTPICDGARIYVAMKRRDLARVQLHVACFEAHSGRRIWRTLIASRDHWGEGGALEISHTLLSLAHHRLFVNTNMGAIASLNARSGDLRWVTAYPRAAPRPEDIDKSDRHYFRELNPCVVHRDLVISAPTDSNRIFALEESTGRMVWTTRPGVGADATHLLGIGDETLIASGNSIYWIDVVSGRALCQFPPATHRGDGFGLGEPRGIGRGTLAGGSVYFPTRDAIYVFAQRPQRVPGGWEPVTRRAPIDLRARGVEAGNLVVSGEYLIIAGYDELAVFSTTSARRPAEKTSESTTLRP